MTLVKNSKKIIVGANNAHFIWNQNINLEINEMSA